MQPYEIIDRDTRQIIMVSSDIDDMRCALLLYLGLGLSVLDYTDESTSEFHVARGVNLFTASLWMHDWAMCDGLAAWLGIDYQPAYSDGADWFSPEICSYRDYIESVCAMS